MPLPDTTILLFQRYIDGSATGQEQDELMSLLKAADGEGRLDTVMEEMWEGLQVREGVLEEERKEEMVQAILQKETGRVRSMVWKRIVSIAAVFILLATGSYFFFSRKDRQVTEKTIASVPADIPAPQNTRAVITLADGRKIYLDSAGNGTLAQEDDVKVVRNQEGEIIYDLATLSPAKGHLQYNTLFNPRGSKAISLTLSDGTKVWLNSESSLKYPTAFTGNTREVEITGEAYFEVAHMPDRPFLVKKGETEVTVLGTHFNVNAYDDEDALRITLLEGSVKISDKGQSAILKPGQQAVATTNHKLQTINSVDLESTVAWKNGRFLFRETSLKDIMRQTARWYNVDVIYEDEVNEVFSGSIPRNVDVLQLFHILEITEKVKFEIRGKQIIVKAVK